MEKFLREFKNAGIGIAVVLGVMYIVMLIMVLLLSGCGVNRIQYKQTEFRLLNKPDSLNMKIKPAEYQLNSNYYE